MKELYDLLVREFTASIDILKSSVFVVKKLAESNPGPTVALLGIFVPFLLFLLARPDRRLQKRRIYMDLEFESARIFRTCIDHPEIIQYLDGANFDGSESDKRILEERVYWYVCQVLNTFELMISLFKERMVEVELLSTWVSWFFEVGAAPNFVRFWHERNLSYHYKADLQEIMDVALEISARNGDAASSLAMFHRRTAKILGDQRILRYFEASCRGRDRRLAVS